MSEQKLYGFTGKILRVNLSNGEIYHSSTCDYVPKYIGGRGVAYKIFWDEVAPGVQAFDAENKLIIMTGPTTATGLPTGGRISISGIAPQCLPEQFSWSGMGGWFGAELKYAGYDGLVIEGKAEKPCYIWIEDDKVEICDAVTAGVWGMYTYDAQLAFETLHGKEVKSLVIGPSGENLLRMAIVATANETAAAKGGFGAVFGSKLCKGVVVRGTKSVQAADYNKVLALRKTMGVPMFLPNPIKHAPKFFGHGIEAEVEGGVSEYQTCCSHGCNQHCPRMLLDVKSVLWKEKRLNQVSKCVGPFAVQWINDCPWMPAQTFFTAQNDSPPCLMMSGANVPPDLTDPMVPHLFDGHPGDTMNLWDGDYERGMAVNELCSQYGVNKWDVIVWLMPWLSMGKKEGVFAGIDFDLGMEPDPSNQEFMFKLLTNIVYRRGYWGNLLADGMARAIRVLGKEKFGDTVYKQRFSNRLEGQQLDIPISLEVAWGYSAHWNGRGYEGSIPIEAWLPIAVMMMTSSRDAQTNGHHHDTIEYALEMRKDPYYSMLGPQSTIMNEHKSEQKEAITSCDWQLPDVMELSKEAEIYNAATGLQWSEEEMDMAAERLKNLFRAILIRNHGRTREMEVAEILPFHRYPDADGVCIDEEGFNVFVDHYYQLRGWDIASGWPLRETYERLGLTEVADQLAAMGKLPV